MTSADRPLLLVLASTYPRWPGDPEPGFVHELAQRMADTFRVIALVPHATGARVRETLDGVEVLRYRYAPARWETLVNDGGIIINLRRSPWKWCLVPPFLIMQLWHAIRLLRSRKVDVMHAHWLLPQGLIAAITQSMALRPVPFLVTSHGADLHALRGRWAEAIKRYVLRRAAGTTVVSGAMREHLSALGVDVRTVSVAPMGVDMQSRFSPNAGTTRQARMILFVGRLVEKKGLRHLLDAMPRVVADVPEARLVVAGFGPEAPELRERVATLGLDGAVEFLGAVQQERLPALYCSAAVFVAPFVKAGSGDEEGLGLVVVEALGCGCPVLVGQVPAVEEVLGESYGEFAIDVRQKDRLAMRIIDILGQPVQARADAARLRGRLLRRFDWGSVADRYRALLVALVSGGDGGH